MLDEFIDALHTEGALAGVDFVGEDKEHSGCFLSFPSLFIGNPGSWFFLIPLLCKEGLGEVEYKLDLPHPSSPYKGEGPRYNPGFSYMDF